MTPFRGRVATVIGRATLGLVVGVMWSVPSLVCAEFGVGARSTTDQIFDYYAGARSGALVLQPDGALVTGGTAPSGSFGHFAVARFTAGGVLDTGFGSAGVVAEDFGGVDGVVNGLIVQPDGMIVAAGATLAFPHFSFALARYDGTGALDPTFGSGGTVTTHFGTCSDQANALVLQPDGKLVAAGYTSSGPSIIGTCAADLALVRYDVDGSLDATFGSGGIVTTDLGTDADEARALVLQPDGKLVVAASTFVAGREVFALVRYADDGALDASFGVGGIVTTDFVGPPRAAHALVLQPDGKLVVAGERRAPQTNDIAIARYDSDGTIDASFGTGGVAATNLEGDFETGLAVVRQADGKLVVAGQRSDGTVADFVLVRFDANGVLDADFAGGGSLTDFGGGPDAALALAAQPDGKLVASGMATSILGDRELGLVRYNADGTRDECPAAPVLGCRVGDRAMLAFEHRPNHPQRLTWQWSHGPSTTALDFAVAIGVGYQLCVYDAAGPRFGISIPGLSSCEGGTGNPPVPCWKASVSGYTYRDRGLATDGVSKLGLKANARNQATISLRGLGPRLGLPVPPVPTLPLTAQLTHTNGGPCWETTFAAARTNAAGKFKATK